MEGRRLRRRPTINPTLGQRLVLAGMCWFKSTLNKSLQCRTIIKHVKLTSGERNNNSV